MESPQSPAATSVTAAVRPTVLDLVDARADADGTRIAVADRTGTLTYAELRERSSALARVLVDRDVAAGDTVALVGGRDAATIVGLIAVLRAGAIVTMIDPTQQAQRVRRVLDKAGPALVLTVGERRVDPAEGTVVARIEDLEREPASSTVLPVVAAEDPAYLCFTSGSTGEPTGVLGWHGALAHFCAWEQAALEIGPDDRVAQMAALTFDAFFKDVFPALIGGATVSLPPTDTPFVDLGAVLDWWTTSEVSLVQTVPSVLSALLTEAPAGFRPAIRLVCLSGEPLSGALVERWREVVGDPAARVVNLYGTTEATILQAHYEVPVGDLGSGVLPVGTGIDGVDLVVVNRRGRVCGVGEPGEVLIRSPYLTRGRWRPSHGEAELFEPSPVPGDAPDVLVQRTGDLGRLRPDGVLEIQGRADDQVKLLGVRVQPAEVAALIASHAEVDRAAVIARSVADQVELVAYVVPTAGARPTADQVREHVAAHGSNAMTPARVVLLDRLPLNDHGKLDRRALPDPAEVEDRADAGGSSEDWTETERRVAAIWSEAFKRPITERDANFFELGGHSLMMARLLARVRREFGVELSLPTLFSASTVAGLAVAVDAAGTPAEDTAGAPASAPATGDDASSGGPLSAEQEGLWFLQQEGGAPSAYNMAGVFRLPRETDLDRVREAYREVCARHEALRLRFREVDGVPRQVPGEPDVDVAVLAGQADRAAALAVLAAEAAEPFDLATGPLVRLRLVRTDDELLVGLTIHHLCCDGISWSLLAAQVDARLAGATDEAPGSDYCRLAALRSVEARGPEAAADVEYWTKTLADAPALDLPAGRPTGGSRPHENRVCRVRVPEATATELVRRAAGLSATEYMAWLALVGTALGHAADLDDVTVGSDSAGRDAPETQDVVGFFVRTHAYRLDLSGDPSYQDAVARVRDHLVEASGHRRASYPAIVEAVVRARGGERRPLFSAMMRMPPREEAPRSAALLEAVDVVAATDGPGAAPVAKFALTVVVRPGADGTAIDLEYDADLVQEEYVAALGEHLLALAEHAARTPAGPLSQAGGTPHPLAGPLPELDVPSATAAFAEQVRTRPDAVALRAGGESVTYGELAEAVASVQAGAVPGERVGLVGGKSPATVAALAGLVGAGSVPVPLDEGLPEARRRDLLERAGATRVLDARPDATGPDRIAFDALRAGGSRDLAPAAVAADSPAYVFFTSGTTGEPKGVVGSRGGLDHFVAWEGQSWDIAPGDRVAQITTLSFDAVLRDVFVPLSRGATICLPPEEATEDPGRMLAWLADEQVTVVHTTPSVVAAWLRADDVRQVPSLRLVCLAGEPLTGGLVRELRARLLPAGARVVNFYGPTETTMIKASYEVPADQPDGAVPVGWGQPGADVVVVGEHDRPCGTGQRGEVVIRTRYRTLGYLGGGVPRSPFEVNPFGTDPADLLFRTGDNAVVGTDGALWLEGRRDDMVKIRGVRVHPQEVAAVLATHPEVAQAHVEKGADQESLTAYVVRAGGTDPSPASLREHAQERLPAAMVPAQFVPVAGFTLLPNGKIDRRALDAAVAPEAPAATGPRTDMERVVWAIWTDLVGRSDFGVTDDFFAVGGHSLLATILLTRVRKQTGFSLKLREMLEGPTVEQMAARLVELSADRRTEESPHVLELRAGRPGGPVLFLVHPIGGDVLSYRDLANALPEEVTVVGLRAAGLEAGTPFGSIQEMAAAYLHEVRRIQSAGPYLLAGWSMGGVVAYEMARQLSFEAADAASVVLIDSYAPGSRAFEHFAGPREVLAESFVRDLARMTGQQVAPEDVLTGTGGESEALVRRFEVFAAHARALSGYRLRRAGLRDARFALVLAGDQARPDGVGETLGWEAALGSAPATEVVAGADHFSLFDSTHAAEVAAAVVRALDLAPERTGAAR